MHENGVLRRKGLVNHFSSFFEGDLAPNETINNSISTKATLYSSVILSINCKKKKKKETKNLEKASELQRPPDACFTLKRRQILK